MLFTATEENYIKAIYHLQQSLGKAGTTVLAEAMQTRPATVTDMLKKLEAKKLLHYQRYKGFSLTESGNRLALLIIRKHRLWEYFLVHKLGFNWDEVHHMAEELEHISSRELITRLDEYLGKPAFDPHGDPIPDGKGRLKTVRQENLMSLPLKKILVVQSVRNQSADMLEMLNHYHIGIGTKLKVLRRFAFDGSAEIKVDKQPITIISNQVAQNVYCCI